MLTGKELGDAIAQALQQNDKTQADAARAGLWADPDPMPPWEWRHKPKQ